jgi:hypothetical protein
LEIFHQSARRSFDFGSGRPVGSAPAAKACSINQSFSGAADGMQLRIRFVRARVLTAPDATPVAVW